jgi:hypothetical protein
MPSAIVFPCPHCQSSYDLTPEYLAEFGGQNTTCATCGNAFQIPVAQAADAVTDVAPAPILSYAAPVLSTKPVTGTWQDRGCVVFTRGKSLPRRCPKCGQAAMGKPTWLRFSFRPARFVGFGIMAAAIEAVETEETSLAVYFCPKHYSRYHMLKMLSWLLPLCGVPCFIAGTIANGMMVRQPIPDGLMFGAVGIPIGIFCWKWLKHSMTIVFADKRFAWLKGCGEEFIASLPDLRSAQDADAAATAEKLAQLGD